MTNFEKAVKGATKLKVSDVDTRLAIDMQTKIG